MLTILRRKTYQTGTNPQRLDPAKIKILIYNNQNVETLTFYFFSFFSSLFIYLFLYLFFLFFFIFLFYLIFWEIYLIYKIIPLRNMYKTILFTTSLLLLDLLNKIVISEPGTMPLPARN